MTKKLQTDSFYEHVGKYNFEYNKFILPVIQAKQSIPSTKVTISGDEDIASEDELTAPRYNLEPFKYEDIPIRPSLCLFTFMSESEVLEVKHVKMRKKLESIFAKKLSSFNVKGIVKRLLIELLISVVKFCNKFLYDSQQTGALLGIFYNTHLYISYHLFATAEDIYYYFKEYIYYHSITFPPDKVKIFEVNEAKQIILYFHSIYVRHLPLVRMLMFPNYGFLLNITQPEPEVLIPQKGKKKKEKK